MEPLNCPWPLDVTQCCDSIDENDAEVVASAIAQASALMTRLSGYTIGECEQTIRPLEICGRCRSWCCGGTDGIRLAAKDYLPIASVTRVRVGPTGVDPSTWRFDEETQMLWRVPPDVWPRKDERWAEAGTGEAFVVDVVVGTEPDVHSRAVATLLACEIVRSCKGQKCRLPKNATQVVGQGITITLSDQEIKTLLPEVAGWMQIVNPYNATLPARVMSPDLESGFRGGCCG